ncbi:hypothetical protein PAHAL_5G011900 [Panicum hallii]|uniref:Uncharacterized protein n=1 Tax=Panicum hallii TaxID=206008 RepID=A0A2S3HMY2_9POAL|nr:hypothetical protein PAHAL_5G011900 [Panicum hallii]
MEALTATPRALFPRASPAAAALMATARRTPSARRRCAAPVRASAAAAEPAGDDGAAAAAPKKVLKKKPVYSMKKGQIVRVDKEKYLNSINYLSVGHPPFYKGLDYIYEDRGEVITSEFLTAGSIYPQLSELISHQHISPFFLCYICAGLGHQNL